MDRQVTVVGCEPKADSTRLLLGGLAKKSVFHTLREEGEDVELDDIRKPKRLRLSFHPDRFLPFRLTSASSVFFQFMRKIPSVFPAC